MSYKFYMFSDKILSQLKVVKNGIKVKNSVTDSKP